MLEKGGKEQLSPHQLIMTATPIPRTPSDDCLGSLETSVIDELPWKKSSSNLFKARFLKRQSNKKVEEVCLTGKEPIGYALYCTPESLKHNQLRNFSRRFRLYLSLT